MGLTAPDNRDPVVVEARPAVMGASDEDVVDDFPAALKLQDWYVHLSPSCHWNGGMGGWVTCLDESPSGPFPFFSRDAAGRVHLREVNERLWVGW